MNRTYFIIVALFFCSAQGMEKNQHPATNESLRGVSQCEPSEKRIPKTGPELFDGRPDASLADQKIRDLIAFLYPTIQKKSPHAKL
jgi:hypothetical protein